MKSYFNEALLFVLVLCNVVLAGVAPAGIPGGGMGTGNEPAPKPAAPKPAAPAPPPPPPHPPHPPQPAETVAAPAPQDISSMSDNCFYCGSYDGFPAILDCTTRGIAGWCAAECSDPKDCKYVEHRKAIFYIEGIWYLDAIFEAVEEVVGGGENGTTGSGDFCIGIAGLGDLRGVKLQSVEIPKQNPIVF
ncbi:hypothetical protein N431DRAFT_458447 [Stipitochalara longipes BDJ]|nr:hypothetical protein N431DRAFT_458447 [Stipitochalara longipes BDJ]